MREIQAEAVRKRGVIFKDTTYGRLMIHAIIFMEATNLILIYHLMAVKDL